MNKIKIKKKRMGMRNSKAMCERKYGRSRNRAALVNSRNWCLQEWSLKA
jgi:hypothetical protein